MSVVGVLMIVASVTAGGAGELPSEQKRGVAPELDNALVVVRVAVADRSDVDRVAGWLEPWEVNLDEGYLVVDVWPHELQRLRDLGFTVEVDAKRTARFLESLPRPLRGQTEGIPGYPCYRTVEETLTTGAALAQTYPDLAQWIDIGDSWEKTQSPGTGYDLMLLRLTNTALGGSKPILYLEGAIHARELTTAELATRFAEHLLAGYGADPDTTWLLDHQEVHVLLQTNPDGRKMAESGLSWRKNTNSTSCGDPSRWGVDLNRNFPFEWGCCGGSSGDGCDPTFRGYSAESEPETQAVTSYVRSVFPDQRPDDLTTPAMTNATGLFIDVHSHGEVILSSWGFTTSPPPNGDQILRLARKLGYLNNYDSQLGSSYTVDGSTKDFAYGELGVPGYTFELGTAFFQDCSAFESTIYPDNVPALMYAAKAARAPYRLPAGPDALAVAIVPSVVAEGDLAQLTATIDDTRYETSGGVEPSQNIAAADLFVDLPPWNLGAVPEPMSAADGAFNSTVEDVVATVDTTGWSEGRHTVFVRGEDANGSLGAVSAAFLWVLDPVTAPRLEGTVTSGLDGSPLDATITAGPFVTATDPATGAYELMVTAGSYDVTASAVGHLPMTFAFDATTGTTVHHDFVLPHFRDILDDDVESGNIGWTADAPWAITTEASTSPTHSWTDSPGGNYGDYADVSLLSPLLDLTDLAGSRLEFSHIYDIESGYDYGHVEVSTDGGSNWTEVASYTGVHTSTWERVEIDLPQLDGVANGRIRFRLTSDGSETHDGWHIDDIALRAAWPDEANLLFMDGFEIGDTTRWTTTVP